MLRSLDLVDDGDAEVGARDEGFAVGIRDDDVAAVAVAAGALAGVPGAETARGVHEEPVATRLLALQVFEHADHLECLGLELLGESGVDDARPARRDEAAASAADDAQAHAIGQDRRECFEVGTDESLHLTARGDGADDDLDTLELGGQTRNVQERTLDIGRARDAIGGHGAGDGEHRVAAVDGFGDDVAAGVTGAAEDCDEGHEGVPSVGCLTWSAAWAPDLFPRMHHSDAARIVAT